jgi:pimeloyl-ACP methyl ester carboxylesterase
MDVDPKLAALSHFVQVGSVRTHYLEAGSEHRGKRPTLLLLHSAEFGGCAELSWERNILPLAQTFHVLAPDHLGFGSTDKVFDFENQYERRIAHIRDFLVTLDVKSVYAVGSSMSGGMCLAVAAATQPTWPLAGVVCCSGGGEAPDNDARRILNSYDGSDAHMRDMVGVLFLDRTWAEDEAYIRRRVEISRRPGAWECAAAARFKAPFKKSSGGSRAAIDYPAIQCPVLVFAGRHDKLRHSDYTDEFVPRMKNARLHVFEHAAHLGNVECADEFNRETLSFLESIPQR